MNCSDWEREIASESGVPGLEEHLRQCARCHEFAREIEANRAALQQLTVHPAALDTVRRRVLDDIQAQRRRIWWQWPVAAALLAACGVILSVIFLEPRRKPEAPKPATIAVKTLAPQAITPARTVAQTHHRPRIRANRIQARVAAAAQETLQVKMLTNDPDVIIIWLVDQKGD